MMYEEILKGLEKKNFNRSAKNRTNKPQQHTGGHYYD